MAAAMAAASPLGTIRAVSASSSRWAGMSLATMQQPLAIASATTRGWPSWNDGASSARAWS